MGGVEKQSGKDKKEKGKKREEENKQLDERRHIRWIEEETKEKDFRSFILYSHNIKLSIVSAWVRLQSIQRNFELFFIFSM